MYPANGNAIEAAGLSFIVRARIHHIPRVAPTEGVAPR
jgi:hypothetical protein